MVSSCATGVWCTETAPIASTILLHSVWAISASNVLAVGDSGTIIQRTTDWAVMTSGTTNDLRGVWAASATNAWAVGVSGTILRFNGTAWSTVTGVTTSDVDAVWGSGPNDVWLAGESTAWHWNGSTFTSFSFGGTMLSVGGSSSTDVWVTGENTNLHHWTGSSFTTVNPGAGTNTFFSVISLSPSNVWAADTNPGKETTNFNGSKWTTHTTSGSFFQAMSALSATDIWGAGGSHTGHWNGTSWSMETPFGSGQMFGVTTTAGNAWVVGASALIGHRTF